MAARAELNAGKVALGLHDLTGFEGRVDAILLTQDAALTPPADFAATNQLRRQSLGLPEIAPRPRSMTWWSSAAVTRAWARPSAARARA
jgi:hypothetical protein